EQNISSLKALASRTYPCLSRDILGYKTLESTQRRLWCPHCGTILDRDENAARNLAAGGLRFSPDGPPGKAMVEEREPENATLILKVDGGKLSQQATTTIHPTKT